MTTFAIRNNEALTGTTDEVEFNTIKGSEDMKVSYFNKGSDEPYLETIYSKEDARKVYQEFLAAGFIRNI